MTGVAYFALVGMAAFAAFAYGLNRMNKPPYMDPYMQYKMELADRSDLDRDALAKRD